jgi:hypothetical protein
VDTSAQHLVLGIVVAVLAAIQSRLDRETVRELAELRARIENCENTVLELRALNRAKGYD